MYIYSKLILIEELHVALMAVFNGPDCEIKA